MTEMRLRTSPQGTVGLVSTTLRSVLHEIQNLMFFIARCLRRYSIKYLVNVMVTQIRLTLVVMIGRIAKMISQKKQKQ